MSGNIRNVSVAIVGAGFSGAILAARLLEFGNDALTLALIEQGPCRARGIAYSTQEGRHLLNVPAANMSAIAEDPDHFLEWARTNFDSGVQPRDFLPRRVYGQYIESVLDEAVQQNPGRLTWVRAQARALRKNVNGAVLTLDDGNEIIAGSVVLALGNLGPAAPFPMLHSKRSYVANPWVPGALDGASMSDDILLIGSGLTAIDALLSLRAKGCRGTIHMLSRHGLLPQTHSGSCTASLSPPFPPSEKRCSVRDLTRWLRDQARSAESSGSGWRSVFDALRPQTQKLWNSLSPDERRRFHRHLRPYWEAHRHRLAPQIGQALDHQLQTETLKVHAGRISWCQEDSRAAVVSFVERTSRQEQQLAVGMIVNCTGPASDIRKAANPLLADCLRQGLARPDALSLGLDSTVDGAVIDAQGGNSDVLYTIGPLRKGTLWESIAVPELRIQAAELASLLAGPVRAQNDLQLAEAASFD